MRLLFVNEFDTEFLAAAAKGGAAASGDDAGADAGGVGERQALAVMSVESFDFEAEPSGCDRSVTLPSVIVPSTSMRKTLICLARLATADVIFFVVGLATIQAPLKL